jgi:hypothetical protein
LAKISIKIDLEKVKLDKYSPINEQYWYYKVKELCWALRQIENNFEQSLDILINKAMIEEKKKDKIDIEMLRKINF